MQWSIPRLYPGTHWPLSDFCATLCESDCQRAYVGETDRLFVLDAEVDAEKCDESRSRRAGFMLYCS